MICDAMQTLHDYRQAKTAEDSEECCVLRTAYDDESIVRPLGFDREKSEAFDDQFTVFSQKNYRVAQ